MSEQEIIATIIDEIKEYHFAEYRHKNHEGYDELIFKIANLRTQMDEILSELQLEKAEAINKYIAKISALADKDCTFLYVQGAKDCVKLLKRLGVINA